VVCHLPADLEPALEHLPFTPPTGVRGGHDETDVIGPEVPHAVDLVGPDVAHTVGEGERTLWMS
jgi:hypothetical protein